ncbi:hypothetical protein ABID52_002827 [Fictibacillus halophilus]|uniref:Uncharacterized protein n=1 Tax=Fictibacillus halophilus TaxID=1610490 RepID=A0ABV2LKY5_9BACL
MLDLYMVLTLVVSFLLYFKFVYWCDQIAGGDKEK